MLTKEEKINEIKRIEERSLFYLKFFTAFWSTLLFFIIKNIVDTGKEIRPLLENIILQSNLGTRGIFMSLGFTFLIIFIPWTIIKLSKNTLNSFINELPDSLDGFVKFKLDQLNEGWLLGLSSSFILVVYLFYLYLIDENYIVSLFKVLDETILPIIFFVIFITPVFHLLKNIKKWKKAEMSIRIFDICAIIFAILGLLNRTGVVNLNAILPRNSIVMLSINIVMMLVIFYYLYLFFKLSQYLSSRKQKMRGEGLSPLLCSLS